MFDLGDRVNFEVKILIANVSKYILSKENIPYIVSFEINSS
jgi:hypothetical protein